MTDSWSVVCLFAGCLDTSYSSWVSAELSCLLGTNKVIWIKNNGEKWRIVLVNSKIRRPLLWHFEDRQLSNCLNTLWHPICLKVAKVNPRDGSYLLRDHFYKLVQKDWPDYSKEERQLIDRLLTRWVIIQPEGFFIIPHPPPRRLHPLDSTLIQSFSKIVAHQHWELTSFSCSASLVLV